MRIVYLGTPDFAVLPLESIIKCGKDKVIAVITNKDKPVGRKQILTPPPVKETAEKYGIPVYQYDKIRIEGVNDLKALNPDIMITCAFGQILSQEILDIPRLGVINIHGSLLPKYRGASPIQSAILNGEKESGITIMKTDIGIDTGDILLQEKVKIEDSDTARELFDKLSVLGAKTILNALDLIRENKINPIKQKEEDATLSKMIKKESAKIDFYETKEKIVDKIRAYNPWPVAFFTYNGQTIKVYGAKPDERKGQCGEVLVSDKELVIGTENGSVSLLTVQKAGGNKMNISDFLRGNKIVKGEIIK
ncbi:MAG: methionyl-tRNA formyltransferase [Clostridia bacterium]|nr:methionyl-tRNA formyltransferase [Clostridia bacterium]